MKLIPNFKYSYFAYATLQRGHIVGVNLESLTEGRAKAEARRIFKKSPFWYTKITLAKHEVDDYGDWLEPIAWMVPMDGPWRKVQ